MDYQYNQQQIPPQAVPQYADYGSIKAHKKKLFADLAEKMTAFFSVNPILRLFASCSHIISYIVTGIGFVFSIIVMICMHTFPVELGYLALVFGLLAVSKKTLLPLSISLSYVAIFNIVALIAAIVSIASIPAGYSIDAGYMVGFVFEMVFRIVESIVLVILSIVSWLSFAATLDPPQVQYAQYPYGQAPVQEPAQYAQQPAQYAQQPAANKVCPQCSTVNAPDTAFCKNCGTKL